MMFTQKRVKMYKSIEKKHLVSSGMLVSFAGLAKLLTSLKICLQCRTHLKKTANTKIYVSIEER